MNGMYKATGHYILAYIQKHLVPAFWPSPGFRSPPACCLKDEIAEISKAKRGNNLGSEYHFHLEPIANFISDGF